MKRDWCGFVDAPTIFRALECFVTDGNVSKGGSRIGVELYAELGRGMSAGLIAVDSNERILLANESAKALLSITGDPIGKRLAEVTPHWQPLLAPTMLEQQERLAVATGEDTQRIVQFASEGINQGKYRLILLWDATKLAEDERRRLRAQQLEAAGRIAARLSHEMRDPLAVIFAGIQSLERESSISKDDATSLGFVLDAARAVVRTLKRFVDSSSPGAAAGAVVPVHRLLGDCIEDLKSIAADKGVSLKLLGGPENVELFVDEKTMSRAVKNLILNSLEACKHGDSVKISWRELSQHEKTLTFPGFAGKVVGIYGEDTGSGLPQDLSESSIFRPFITTKPSGTGLGLSVAQEIVELQGGVISLSSLATGGTVFEILLPAGERVPCWKVAETESCEDPVCGTTCDDCEVKNSGSAQFCWVVKGRHHRARSGFWLQRCLGCPVFRSLNLAAYFDPRGRPRKD
jgi:signal transduction histidine kinase